MLRSVIACLLLATVAAAAWGQSLSERIADYRRRQQDRDAQEAQAGQTPDFIPIPKRLAAIELDPVELREVSLRRAVTWFAKATDIPVVVQWERLESEGVDIDAPVTLQLRHVPAERFLNLLAQQGSSATTPLLFDVTPWYVELLTRRQANARVVTRIYPVEDLVMEIPRFTGAPNLNLSSALSSSGPRGGGAGGGTSSGGGNLFSDTQRDEATDDVEQRGEALAQLVRDTIEPDIWIENGGEFSSCRYSHGRLIVRAPRYVHRQIGGPASGAIGPRTAPEPQPAPPPSPPAPAKP